MEVLMKRLFFMVLILAIASLASAQTSPVDKGSMILGGSAYFMSQSGDLYEVDGDGTTTIGLEPEFGYFISPNIMIGGTLLYESEKMGDYKTTCMGIGPEVGYFFNMDKGRTDIKGSIYPYIKGFMTYKSEKSENGTETKYDYMSFGAKGGIIFMLSEAVALDMGLKFSSDSQKQKEPEVAAGADDSISGSTFMLGVGVTAFIWK
jgi:hypothetical protein